MRKTYLAALFLLACACAGPALKTIHSEDPLQGIRPSEIPAEMAAKFQIKDNAHVPAPAPSPSPTPEPMKKKRTNKIKAKLVVAEPEPVPSPAPLMYPSRRPEKEPFWEGERLTYEVTYFGTLAGQFSLNVMPFKFLSGRKVYHFQGLATTSALYSLIYRAHEMIETYMDFEGLFSHRFRIIQDESKQYRDGIELHDYEKQQTFYWNRWRPVNKPGDPTESKEYGQIAPFGQDWLSMIYFMRAQKLAIGDVLEIPVISETKTSVAKFTVVKKDVVETNSGDINAVVLRADEVSTNGIAAKVGDSFFWLSDDDRHYLLKGEAKVKIGTLHLKVIKIEPGIMPQ